MQNKLIFIREDVALFSLFFLTFVPIKHHDMEHLKIFTQLIANELHLSDHAVENTLKLLDEGCTIPFISRYRKERTGGLDEVQITSISNRLAVLQEIAKRKDTVIKTITELATATVCCMKKPLPAARSCGWNSASLR